MTDQAARYLKRLNEMEWLRATVILTRETEMSIVAELQKIWETLGEQDREAIEKELALIDQQKNHRAYLCLDQQVEIGGTAGPRQDTDNSTVVPGDLYRHYKGGEYMIVRIARNSEDPDQRLVCYESTTTGDAWVRPLDMFLENVEVNDVEVNGVEIPRFSKIQR